MGLIDSLNNAIKNYTAINIQKRSFLGAGFNPTSLKEKELKADTFTQLQVVETPIDDYNLAIKQPARFIKNYINEATIKNAIEKNSNIEKILKESHLSCEYNLENAESIIMSHLIPTARTAQKVYINMGHYAHEQNYLYLTQAALLHDIGKVFIPSGILNKKGKLNSKERSIIELHNQLSYEILKTTNLNPKVAQLAYEHHNYNNDVKRTHENQAITISDVYCALREDRPYKKPITDICAKAILYDMGTKGSFETKYINCLTT